MKRKIPQETQNMTEKRKKGQKHVNRKIKKITTRGKRSKSNREKENARTKKNKT